MEKELERRRAVLRAQIEMTQLRLEILTNRLRALDAEDWNATVSKLDAAIESYGGTKIKFPTVYSEEPEKN